MATPVYMRLRTQNEWKAYLQGLLRTNDKALLRSIIVLYERQTPEERTIGQSTEDNGRGFTKWDAEKMSHIAMKIKKGTPLSHDEMVYARITMPKYWRQLMEVSKRNVAKRLEIEYNKAEAERLAHNDTQDKAVTDCICNGTACEYGICNECPANRGVQMCLWEDE